MDQAIKDNFVSGKPETAPGSSSIEVIEVMDQEIESNFVTENLETAPGSEGVIGVMDQAIEDNFVTENPITAPGSEGVIEVMNQAIEDNFVSENPETGPGSSSEEVIDSNENVVDVVPDIKSKNMKNKAGNAKSKIQKDKTKKMTVESVAEGKSLKRKAAHPPTSEMVMDSIKALQRSNGVSFQDIRLYMEDKYVVDMKYLKHHVEKFLQKSVDNGVLDKLDKGGAGGRFKIKKSENIKRDSKNMPQKEGKVKPKKKMAATKQRVKK